MAQSKTHDSGVVEQGKRAAKKVARSTLVERLSRLGYAVRGLLYGLVGVLAASLVLVGQGKLTDRQGAIATLGTQPLGKFLLILIAAGLAGYAVWGIIRAVFDPLNKGTDAKGIIARLGFLVSGLSYAALEIPTIRLLMNLPGGASGGGEAASQQRAVGAILTKPWGPWVVGLIGLVIIGAGVSQILQGWQSKFDMRFDSYSMNASQRRWATRLGRFGYIARGIVFDIIGFFLFQAALYSDPSRARGIDGALAALLQQPYGKLLLGVVAFGLIAFGLYSMLGAAWFRFKKA